MKDLRKCRSCREVLIDILSLGDIKLSDFRSDTVPPPAAPLDLMLCGRCYLVQLKESTPPDLLYTKNYGFKSGINNTIRADLREIVDQAIKEVLPVYPSFKSTVIDIGANDGTLLSNYPAKHFHRVGVDPVSKLSKELATHADEVVSDYFTAAAVEPYMNNQKAQIITSISMFYDLEEPNKFVKEVASLLAYDGVWIIQQNYLASMLTLNAYDNICHEHIEYYTLTSMKPLIERHGMEIYKVSESTINGGSFRTFIRHKNHKEIDPSVYHMLEREKRAKLDTMEPYIKFGKRIAFLSQKLHDSIEEKVNDHKTIYLYGASTRGNTLLQVSKLNKRLIRTAVERNPEKVGKRIASLQIPIISEEKARQFPPEYMLVLPWFFKNEFIKREHEYLKNGGTFIVPLPEVREYSGSIAIYIPTLGRANVLEKLARNIHDNTIMPHKIYFIVEPYDDASNDAVRHLGETYFVNEGEKTYANCVDMAYKKTDEKYFVCANDDFKFHYGWDIAALDKITDRYEVIGLNDLSGTNYCNTIFLVTRNYIETKSGVVDQPNTIYYGYDHNYVDTEFYETAVSRGVFRPCPEAVVEHMHWSFGKAPMDKTYQKNIASSERDKQTFLSRQHLWQSV